MAKIYEYTTQEPEDVKVIERVIRESEEVTETKESEFTLKEKLTELESAKEAVVTAQERVTSLEAEITATKKALSIADKDAVLE